MKQLNQVSIRHQNVVRIWDLLTERQIMTRHEMAQATGLSLMTVTNLVDLLNETGQLDFVPAEPEQKAGRKSVGRKAERISISKTKNAFCVIDLSEEFFRFTALRQDLEPILPPFKWLYDSVVGYTENLLRFLAGVREIIKTELAKREILGMAVVVPGPYDVAGDTVSNKRIPALNALKVKSLLRENLGEMDYYLDEDMKFAVRAFMPMAARSDSEILYYLYISEGMGGAALHNCNVVRGLNAAAGDAGQMLGQKGVRFEELLSLRAFAALCGVDVRSDMDSDNLIAAVRAKSQGNPSAYRTAVERSADIIAEALYAVTWLLDPAAIVIDCRYAEYAQTIFIDKIKLSLQNLIGGALSRMPKLSPSPFEGSCVLRGAVNVLSKDWLERIIQ
ncbi:MAG: ROK family protein [Oscillospiraceae bacterium]|jgi:glucokinase|nr:ROK family protein [Oscillospiraceae bacterium]